MSKHIGLIGGIGPAATDFYYRRLISTFARHQQPLELTIVHADTPTLLDNLGRGDWRAQVEIYRALAHRLVAADAACVVVTSIAGHFCIERFAEISPLPVIDMIAEVDQAIRARALGRVGVLGTRTVMETRFYGGMASTEVTPLPPPMLGEVHEAYVAMAASGHATAAAVATFEQACDWYLSSAAVDAILLGGTDLTLVFDGDDDRYPFVDCAAIHADAVYRFATS